MNTPFYKLLNEEIIKATKAKDEFRKNVLKMVKSQIEAENKKPHYNGQAIDIASAYHKKLEKSLSIPNVPKHYIEATKKEIAIVEEFLPKDMTTEDIEYWTQLYINEIGMPDSVGQVMVYLKKAAKKEGKRLSGSKAYIIVNKIIK